MAGKPLNSYANERTEEPVVTAAPEVIQAWDVGQQDDIISIAPVEPMEFNQYEEPVAQPEPEVEEEDEDEVEEAEALPEPKQQRKGPSAAENMRAIREAKEKAERERDELMRMIQMQQLQQQAQQQPQVVQPEPEPEFEMPDLDLDDDGLAENRHIKAMHKQMLAMQKQIKAQQQEAIRIQQKTQETMIETRIKSTYPDFDRVVSQENIATFSKMYPEIAQTLHATSDLYNKAVSAYTLIKQFGIAKDKSHSQDAVRALNNVNKPRPLNSISPTRGQDKASPLTRANGFANSDSLASERERLYAEMIESAKGM